MYFDIKSLYNKKEKSPQKMYSIKISVTDALQYLKSVLSIKSS